MSISSSLSAVQSQSQSRSDDGRDRFAASEPRHLAVVRPAPAYIKVAQHLSSRAAACWSTCQDWLEYGQQVVHQSWMVFYYSYLR